MRIIPINDGAEPTLSPDLLWDGTVGDLGLAEPGEPQNRGGLRARSALETATLICLMTDARVEPTELRTDDINRGWLGDTFDLDTAAGEVPIGSKLWLLTRHTVDDAHVPRMAETYALEALQPLVDQGAVALVTATAEADPARNRLKLDIELTDRNGDVAVANSFQILWDNLNGIDTPPA